eukprot:7850808-Alexandrium_andersonii.AAC.1
MATKREIHFLKSSGIFVLGVLMAPARGVNSPAQPVCAGGDGEWTQVQSKGTARWAKLPQKSARTEVSAPS